MKYNNNTAIIRRELFSQVAKSCFAGKLPEQAGRIPIELYPRDGDVARCCVHKTRAVVRQRLMAILGFSIEEHEDEFRPLGDYAKEALEHDESGESILTVIDEACSACVQSNYFVTNACKGCLARPCTVNCPKDAISFEKGQALIDAKKCVNCGKCQKVCPYHAIIYVPIPCEEACPVGAITKDEAGKEEIDYNKCIYCGRCLRECPFGAIMERSQMVQVIRELTGDKKVVAMIAPSIVGQFPGTVRQLFRAIKLLGFDSVIEVALGAEETTANEAEELMERIDGGAPFMTTSCCPAYIEAVKKHIPAMGDKVSHTKTPMHYTGKIVTEESPEAVRVFVGPCIAKRKEAQDDPYVDYVLTFEELGTMFIGKGVDVSACEEDEFDRASNRIGRQFAIDGGVTASVKALAGDRMDLKPIAVADMTRKQINLLKAYARGKAPGNFIEVMSCENGCIGGPGVISSPKVADKQLKGFIEKEESGEE